MQAGLPKDCSGYSDISLCPAINDTASGNYLCSASRTYKTTDPGTGITAEVITSKHLEPSLQANSEFDRFYAYLGADDTGFVGKCWNNATGQFPGPNDVNKDCVKEELLHYCYGFATPPVIDPSSAALSTSEQGNVPAIIMDAGLRSPGPPIAFSRGYFT